MKYKKKQSDSHSNTWVQSCCSDPGDFPNIPSCLSPWRRLHYIRSSHLPPSSPSWVLSWSNKKATIITASQERRSNPQQTQTQVGLNIQKIYLDTLFWLQTLWLCSENSTMVDLNERALLVFFLTSQVSCNFYWILTPIISCQLFVFLNIFLCGDLNFAATKTEISLQGN